MQLTEVPCELGFGYFISHEDISKSTVKNTYDVEIETTIRTITFFMSYIMGSHCHACDVGSSPRQTPALRAPSEAHERAEEFLPQTEVDIFAGMVLE